MPEPVFSPTRWTLVLEAKGETAAARAAMGELCEIYYSPVVDFIRYQRNDHDRDAARDQAHAFFESLLERDAIGDPDPERGRFRNYLLGAVKHFLAQEHRASITQKRGGEAGHDSLDEVEGPAADESHFDRAWALALIGRALGELDAEMVAAGKADQFAILKPWLDGNADVPQSDAAQALGLSETAIKVAIHRLRERLRAKVRAEVAATLNDPAELDAELSHLVAALAAQPA